MTACCCASRAARMLFQSAVVIVRASATCPPALRKDASRASKSSVELLLIRMLVAIYQSFVELIRPISNRHLVTASPPKPLSQQGLGPELPRAYYKSILAKQRA